MNECVAVQCVHVGSWQYDMCHTERGKEREKEMRRLCLRHPLSLCGADGWVTHLQDAGGTLAAMVMHCALCTVLSLARSNSESHQIWLTLHKHRISRHQTPRRLCRKTAKWKCAMNSVINMNPYVLLALIRFVHLSCQPSHMTLVCVCVCNIPKLHCFEKLLDCFMFICNNIELKSCTPYDLSESDSLASLSAFFAAY